MKKSAFSFLLAFCMMISLLSGISLAADSVITLTGGEIERGSTLVVPVTIANNPTIGAANIHVVYDETALKLDAIQGYYSDPDAGMQMGMLSLVGNPAANAIAYAEATGISSDGGLFWLTFSVVETAANGDYSVTLEKLPNTSAMFIGTDGSHLDIAIQPATITVKDPVREAALPITPSENGTITLPVTKAEYGAEVVVTAAPAEGYKFSHLLVGGERVDSLTFTVPEAAEVTVQGVFTAYAEGENAPENAMAKIVTNGGAVYVSTLAELTANVDKLGESVITLLQDVTASQETRLPPCTMDLGGYTWRATAGRGLYFHYDATAESPTNFVTRVENGTVVADASSALGINIGCIQLEDVTLIANGTGGLQMMNGDDNKFNFTADADYSRQNSMVNCVVYNSKSTGYGIGFGNSSDFSNVQFTIENTVVITEGTYYPIDNGKTSSPCTFVLGENVNFYSAATSYTDIAASVTGETVGQVGETNSHTIAVAGITVADVTRWTTEKLAASIGGIVYVTFDDAIDAANKAGGANIVVYEDVVLSENVVAANVVLDIAADVNLDLNGKTLQVSSVDVVEGHIVDTTNGTGLLKCAKDSAFLPKDNPHIPIWDEKAVGYRLTDVVHKAGDDEWTENETLTYTFRFDLANEGLNEIFLANQVRNGEVWAITAGIDVYVDGAEEPSSWEISDDDCTDTNTYIHKLVNNSHGGYKFTLTNAQGANTIEIRSWIMIGGVKHIGGAKIYDNPTSYEDYLNMSFEEKQAFRDTFSSAKTFEEWREQARKKYEADNRPPQAGSDGVIDLEKP